MDPALTAMYDQHEAAKREYDRQIAKVIAVLDWVAIGLLALVYWSQSR